MREQLRFDAVDAGRVLQRFDDVAQQPAFDLFRQRVMAVSTLSGALVGAGMISMVTYVPLYVQGVLGGSPTEAGGAITPMVVGWPIASAIGGRIIPRVGFRPLIRGGLAISALSAAALAFFLRPGASMHVPQLAMTPPHPSPVAPQL